MSEENVELVRRTIDAWNERGPESIEEFWAEDGEWHDPPNLPDSRVVRGRDAVAAFLTDQAGAVGQAKFTIVDVRATGEMELGPKLDPKRLRQSVGGRRA